MSKINKVDTDGVKPLLGVGELGYDNYLAGGDVGRVYVGTGAENIAVAKKSEVDTLDNTTYKKIELDAGQLDNRYYTESEIDASRYTKVEVDAALDLKVDDTEIASVNLLRADKYLAAQNIAQMIYSGGDLTKIQYNNQTDVDYELFGYTAGDLTSISHYIGGVLKGTSALVYTDGDLTSVIFTEV